MGFGDYYSVGIRIGAMEPEDPYTTPSPSKGAGPSWWTLQQYRDKAQAWFDSTSKTVPMVIMIKSNGVKLHSEPHDTIEEAKLAYQQALSNPMDYAYIALAEPLMTPGTIIPNGSSGLSDHMFVPVTPLVHETVKTVKIPTPVKAGMGILGAIGILALAAKAR